MTGLNTIFPFVFTTLQVNAKQKYQLQYYVTCLQTANCSFRTFVIIYLLLHSEKNATISISFTVLVNLTSFTQVLTIVSSRISLIKYWPPRPHQPVYLPKMSFSVEL